MQIPLIAANWKSNFDYQEVKDWLHFFEGKDIPEANVVVFPSFVYLGETGYEIDQVGLPFKVGAQNISPFEEGPYTGEVNVRQVKELAEYVLIGHSERRTNFNESGEMISKKIQTSLAGGLKVILCISNLEELEGIERSDSLTIAFEPLESIGTGKPDDPIKINDIAKQIKNKLDVPVIYGGSVDSSNVSSFLSQENVSGVLVGGESLNPSSFFEIVKNAVN